MENHLVLGKLDSHFNQPRLVCDRIATVPQSTRHGALSASDSDLQSSDGYRIDVGLCRVTQAALMGPVRGSGSGLNK